MSQASRRPTLSQAFFEAHGVLRAELAAHTGELGAPDRPGEEELEKAAKIALEFARSSGDRLALSLVLARFEDFVRFGQTPPKAMLAGLAEIFSAYRGGASMDLAFGIKRGRGGVQDRLVRDEWEKTNANLFAHFHETLGMSVDQAKATVSEYGPDGRGSEATVYRHYLKWKTPRNRKQG
jgi:hypothetical protein